MAIKKKVELDPPIPVSPAKAAVITKLTLDYPSEGLNDMARKINEIIDRL